MNVNTLLKIIKWDIKLIYKYGIIAVALGITAIYCAAFMVFNTNGYENLIALLIFSDPVMYGFLFTTIIILFEKDANIHQALAVTTLTPKQYLLSKSIVFSVLSLVCSIIMILAVNSPIFNPIIFIFTVLLSATLFVFIGTITVSFVNNFNQFILSIPVVLAPVCIPFLDYFNIYNSWLFYLIPTHASLILFKSSLNNYDTTKVIISLMILLSFNILCYLLAIKLLTKNIFKTSSNE